MTDDAKEVLRQLGFHPNGHRAQQLTPELANRADKILCMTESQRNAVTSFEPAVADRTLRLDPNGDIDDPIGKGVEAYVACAQHIQTLVRMCLDELSIG